MNRNFVKLVGASAAILFLALVFTGPSGTAAQAPKIPVISLKKFMDVPEWQLDITWSAKDSYEDADWSAKAEMTATARFILKQGDKKDTWGRWHAESPQSGNMAFTSFIINKHDHTRTDYKSSTGPIVGAAAVLQVRGQIPDYQLDCLAAFPAKATLPLQGTMDTRVALGTTDIYGGRPVSCTGPLPDAGNTIHGSLQIPLPVPPFVPPLPYTRVGIQFVLQPIEPLAPLVPDKKK